MPDVDETLLPVVPHPKPPGEDLMLRLIAYDISEPKRWRRICEACEDHGVRVQFSIFECWLEDREFQSLWSRLQGLIDPEADRLVAYTLEAGSTRRSLTAGNKMICTERVSCYFV